MIVYSKSFVCLARSLRGAGYRIAGKEWRGNGPGPWFLPLAEGGRDFFHSWEMGCVTGETLDVLHIVSATFAADSGKPGRLPAQDGRWRYLGRLAWSELTPWLDRPAGLWENGHHSREGYNDLLPGKPKTATPLLIRVQRLDLSVRCHGRGRPVIRGRFPCHDTLYDLEVTDSWLKESVCHAEPQKYSLLDPVICVDLEKDAGNRYRKVITSVLFQRRFY